MGKGVDGDGGGDPSIKRRLETGLGFLISLGMIHRYVPSYDRDGYGRARTADAARVAGRPCPMLPSGSVGVRTVRGQPQSSLNRPRGALPYGIRLCVAVIGGAFNRPTSNP